MLTMNFPVVNGRIVEPPARAGLGTQLKHVIHAGLDVVPMPETTRRRIKGCAGCCRREQAINRAEQAIRAKLGLSTNVNELVNNSTHQ